MSGELETFVRDRLGHEARRLQLFEIALTHKSIASILRMGLDRAAPSAEAAPVLLHPNLRGPRYFH